MVYSDNDGSPRDLSSYGFRYIDTFPLPQSTYLLEINNIEWNMRILTKDTQMNVPPTIFKKIQDASTAGIAFDYWLVREEQLSSYTIKASAVNPILLAGRPITGGNIHWYEVGMWFD